MNHSVVLSPATFGRLQAHAVPLVDSIESVISKLLDAYEKQLPTQVRPTNGHHTNRPDQLNPASPPDLTHTKVLNAEFCKVHLQKDAAKWNGLLREAIRKARANVTKDEELRRLVLVNFIFGHKDDEGYKPLEGTGLSVQGQEANAAWKATYHIARQLGCQIDVEFIWRIKGGAAFPGKTGRFSLPG